jgi:hypothetical protein
MIFNFPLAIGVASTMRKVGATGVTPKSKDRHACLLIVGQRLQSGDPRVTGEEGVKIYIYIGPSIKCIRTGGSKE